jgi:hypothetical protein
MMMQTMITNSTKNIRLIALTCSAGALLSMSAMAQENGVATAGDFARAPQAGEPAWQAGVDSGYVFGGAAHFDGVKLGDSDAYNVKLQTGTRVPLNEQWFLSLGLILDNFLLQQVSGAPVPADIHTLRFNTGLGYRLDDKWTFNALVSPSLERLEEVRGQDLGISGGVLARYQVKPSLTWSFGLFASPDSDVRVLPVIGVRWLINDRYTLEVGMPKTRLSYRIDPKWSVYSGLDLNGAVFRAGEDLGSKIGSPQYNNALAVYRDIRLGVGTSYELARGLRAELEAGYSVYREIDYVRIDDHVRFDPAPYVRLGINFRF